MDNPFEIIHKRLSSIEGLLLDIKHPINKPGTEAESDNLMTIEMAAEFLKLTKKTMYQKVRDREVPFMKRGKRLYFLESELMKYLKDGKRQSRDEMMADK